MNKNSELQPLAFLRDAELLVRRFVLREILAPPRAMVMRRRAKPLPLRPPHLRLHRG